MLKKKAHLLQLPDWLAPLLACLFFVAAGALFLPRLGLQNDEALFASPWFAPRDSAYAIKVGHSTLPLMLLSYLGTLKSWIYRPLFRYLGTDILVVRLPMLLAATASVWLFYEFQRKVAGRRAAYIGCGLLAVDATYLLTACFDWGPVALQHLLLLGGLCLVMKFRQERAEKALAAAFFLFGLAMWDKALAVWTMGAMAVSGMVVFPRPILESFRRRRAALALVAFAVGALPLIVYNAKDRLATFRSNVAYDTSDIAHKAYILELTADGSGLFDWMVHEDDQTPRPHLPKGFLERASAGLAKWTGQPRRDLLLAAFCLALLLAPLGSRQDRRAILFALLVMAIAWAQMAITPMAGTSVHHTILLWPFPQMVVAISLAAASRRIGRAGIPALAVVLAVLMGSGAAVLNEYYAMAIRNGGGMNWTDAIFQTSAYLKGVRASAVYCTDWGILDSLRLLNRGKLPLLVGTEEVSKDQLTAADRESLTAMISRPDDLFVSHTKNFEFFPGLNEKLLKFAQGLGYRRELLATIADSYGRPTFEIYRFVK